MSTTLSHRTASGHDAPAFASTASTWSRRSFLGTLAALSVGTLTGCSLGGVDQDDDLSGGSGLGGRAGKKSAAFTYSPSGPYALSASSELSEDYFLVQTHQVDPVKDKVVAYSRADGQVETVLLQDGAVKQIYRDPSQPGGWNVYELPAALSGVLDLAAGISSPLDANGKQLAPDTLKVFYRTAAEPDVLHIAVRDRGDAPSFSTSTVPWDRNAGPLQLTVSFDGSLLVAAMVESGAWDKPDGRLYFWADTPNSSNQPATWSGNLTGFAFNTHTYSNDPGFGHWSAVVTHPYAHSNYDNPTLFLALPFGTFTTFTVLGQKINPQSVNLWTWPMTTGPVNGITMTNYVETVDLPKGTPTGSSGYTVELAKTIGRLSSPSMVVRTLENGPGQKLWMLSPDDYKKAWTWTELVMPADLPSDARVTVSAGTRPLPSSEVVQNKLYAVDSFLDVFTVFDHTLTVIRQAPQADANLDASQPAYAPGIPLQPDVAVMTSQTGTSTGNELVVVDTDGNLQALVKDPVTGAWADAPIHLPAGELEQVSTFRVTVTLVDSWQNPVSGAALQVTSSTPVTALVEGTATSLGAQPYKVTTDAMGQAVLALVADGLSAPTLTVAGDGIPTLGVNPSEPINTYMQGGTTLNNLPPLTDETLAAAKSPDGTAVAPGASNQADAKEAVKQMSLAATQASGAVGAHRSTVLQRRDGRLGRAPTQAELRNILHDLDNWSHDALHAIKKGALKVKDLAYDADHKAFQLFADAEKWAKNVINIVVTDIVDAAHVIHAFLNKLGGYIKDAVEWLKATVLGTLTDSLALADHFRVWTQGCCDFLAGEIRGAETMVEAWLSKEQADVKAKFVDLAKRFGSGTTLSNMAQHPPQGLRATRRTPARSGVTLNRSSDGQDSPHGNWFFQKVSHELRGGLNLPPLDGLQSLLDDFSKAAKAAVTDFEDAFGNFMGFLKTVVTHPDDVRTIGVQKLLLAVADLIDAVFVFAKAVVAAACRLFAAVAGAIPGALDTPLSATPIVGKLLGLVKFIGDIKIGTIVNLIFAFPTVVAYKIAHGAKSHPFADLDTTRQPAGGLGDEASDLQFTAGSVLFLWANFDTLSAAFTAAKQEPPMLFAAIDIAAPIIATFLTVPATKNGEPYFAPPVGRGAGSALDFVSWILGAAPALSAGASLYMDRFAKEDKDIKDMAVYFQCMTAVLSMVTGMVGNGMDEEPSGPDYAIAVLNNMGSIAAPGLTETIAESTAGISVVVTMALTEVCGLIGAVLYGFDG